MGGIREIRRNQSYRVFAKHVDHSKILIGLHLTHVLTLFLSIRVSLILNHWFFLPRFGNIFGCGGRLI